MEYVVDVEYTGSFPNYCCGKWNIVVNGIPLTGIGGGHFNTEGYYTAYSFTEDWDEVSSEYSDGLEEHEWIEEQKKEDPNGLPNGLLQSLKRHGFKITNELLEALYHEIRLCDWRHGQCGGCL